MDAVTGLLASAQAWYAGSPVVVIAVGAVVAVLVLVQGYLMVVAARYSHIPGPPSYPLVSHIPYLLSEPWARFAAFARRYGSLYKLMVFDKLFVVVSDPELVKQIFVTRRHLYPKDSWSYKYFMDILGHGVVTSEGAVWKAKRQLLNPAFNFAALERLQEACFAEATQRLTTKMYTACDAKPAPGASLSSPLPSGGVGSHYDFVRSDVVFTPLGSSTACLELSSTFRSVTLEIISQVALGLRPEQASVFPALFEAVLDELNQRVFQVWRPFLFPRLQAAHKARLARLNEIVFGMIQARRAARAAAGPAKPAAQAAPSAGADASEGGASEEAGSDGSGAGMSLSGVPIFADGSDMLDMLLDSAPHLPDDQLADEVKTQLLAGHETSSMMLTWALYLLTAPGNEAAMARAVGEVDAVLGSSPRPCFRDYKALEYIGWVLQESMRLYSPVPLLNRETSGPDELGGVPIPAGTAVIVSIWALHKDPALWGPDVDAFRPDRFAPEESRGRHPFAYLPFSLGPRNCIGQHLAISEAKVVLGEMLRRFTITLAPGQDAPETDAFVIPARPKKPLYVLVTPRKRI